MSLQAELQEFIRRLKVAEDDARTMKRDLIAIRQGMRDAWTEVGGGVKVCVTTISGKVIGGLATPTALPDSTLQILGGDTGTDYGTYSLASGTYSIDLVISEDDDSLNLVATGPSPRFATGSPVNRSITRCASNNLADVQATPASGYHYMTGPNAGAWPIKNTMSYSEAAVFGNGTLTWSAGVWTKNCSTVTTLATGSCPSVAGVPVHISFTDSGTEFFQTLRSGIFPFCPMAGTCATFANGTMGNGITGITRSYTHADAVTLFSVTITANASSASEFWAPGTGSLSITYFET